MRPTPNDGLRSEPLRAALTAALAGKPAQLEDLFCRYGAGHGAKPNLRLAAAFGVEIAALPGSSSASFDVTARSMSIAAETMFASSR